MLGTDGQQRLRDATVLVAGIGGLGGATATYLAAAGIGRLILLHDGTVEWPDLNRQTLMPWDSVGQRRVYQAQATLQKLYPHVQTDVMDAKVTEVELGPALVGADLVVDARYAMEERFALNRVCVDHDIPMIEAAMYGWEFYVFTVLPHNGPCLHCLFREGVPWQGKGFPVLGSVSAVAGTMAATEAIKRLSGIRDDPGNTLYWFDILNMIQHTIQVKRRPDCPVCQGRVQGT